MFAMTQAAFSSDHLARKLDEMGHGGRFAISPDYFARLFHGDVESVRAMDSGRAFARRHGCEMFFWQATNEVFFVRAVTG